MSDREAKLDRIIAELLARQERGRDIDLQRILDDNQDIAESLMDFIDNAGMLNGFVGVPQNQDATGLNGRADAPTYVSPGDRTVNQDSEDKFAPGPAYSEVVVGSFFAERYQIERTLGEGGMGKVFLAYDSMLNRKVALKIPKFSDGNAERLALRFRREAQAAAKLHHRNICPVHDVGRVGHLDFLTMAFIEGRPLSAYISPKKPLDQRQIALIIRRLALGLQVAHDAGVIHRDLKPSNVMIDDQGEPVVMDFGLAGHVESSADSRLTATGTVLGTPSYMSPEQVRGTKETIGPRSDIYSLGVMLFELLTGRPPFRGNAAMVMGMILVAKPPSLESLREDIDPELAGICEKMMSKSRRSRYASMQEVADELTHLIRRLRDKDQVRPPAVVQQELAKHAASNTAEEIAAIAEIADHSTRRSGAGNKVSPPGIWKRVKAQLEQLDQLIIKIFRPSLLLLAGISVVATTIVVKLTNDDGDRPGPFNAPKTGAEPGELLTEAEPGDSPTGADPGDSTTDAKPRVSVKSAEDDASAAQQGQPGIGYTADQGLEDQPEIRDVRLVGGPEFFVGDQVTVDMSRIDFELQEPSSQGKIECYLERQDDGKRYRIGTDFEEARRSRHAHLATKNYPPGDYKCYLNLLVDSSVVFKAAPMEFKLLKAVPWPTFDSRGRLEGELLHRVSICGGRASTQDMRSFSSGGMSNDRQRTWSGEQQLLWLNGRRGQKLSLGFRIEEAGDYRIQAVFTTAPDYAIVNLWLGSVLLASKLDFYRPDSVGKTQLKDLGTLNLSAGMHKLVVDIFGRHVMAREKYGFGLDYLEFTRVTPEPTKSTTAVGPNGEPLTRDDRMRKFAASLKVVVVESNQKANLIQNPI